VGCVGCGLLLARTVVTGDNPVLFHEKPGARLSHGICNPDARSNNTLLILVLAKASNFDHSGRYDQRIVDYLPSRCLANTVDAHR
ncbi:MAG: hypothetical protein L7V86_05155, partial [Verrucomicrobiales bacterium]|nr:hypothetical protein [Verrucomicrobiales bacterium]